MARLTTTVAHTVSRETVEMSLVNSRLTDRVASSLWSPSDDSTAQSVDLRWMAGRCSGAPQGSWNRGNTKFVQELCGL